MSVHWVKADIAIGTPRSDFDPRVRPLRRGGWGVVKSLGDLSSGPVGLLHSQKTGIKYKKPSYSGVGICCRGSRAIDPRVCKSLVTRRPKKSLLLGVFWSQRTAS